jgi:hypothetical protein
LNRRGSRALTDLVVQWPDIDPCEAPCLLEGLDSEVVLLYELHKRLSANFQLRRVVAQGSEQGRIGIHPEIFVDDAPHCLAKAGKLCAASVWGAQENDAADRADDVFDIRFIRVCRPPKHLP